LGSLLTLAGVRPKSAPFPQAGVNAEENPNSEERGVSFVEVIRMIRGFKGKDASSIFRTAMVTLDGGGDLSAILGKDVKGQIALSALKEIHAEIKSQGLPFDLKDKRVLHTIAAHLTRGSGFDVHETGKAIQEVFLNG